MKKKSPPYAIIGAVVLGLIAILALYKYQQNQAAATQAALDKQKADMQAEIDSLNASKAPVVTPTPTDMKMVYYATQPVEAGAKISAAFFEKKATPTTILPDAYTDATDIVGFYAIRSIEKGDPLTPHNIGKTLPFLSQRIPPGMRALALPVFNSELNNTGGFVVDGDKVDLLFTHMTTDNVYLIDTSLVMQNLEVLYAPGPKIDSETMNGIQPAPAPGQPISVTFLVTPEQAQALTYMTHIKNGQFSMILRSRRDKEEIKIKPFVGADFAGDYHRLQKKIVDPSMARVQQLQAQIEAQEKQQAQATTNETTQPTPPPTP